MSENRNGYTHNKLYNTVKLGEMLHRFLCHILPKEVSIQRAVSCLAPIKDRLEGHEEFEPFIKFLEKHYDEIKGGLNERLAKGEVVFDDLLMIYTPGTEVIMDNPDFGPSGGKVKSSSVMHSFFGMYVQIKYTCISVEGGVMHEREDYFRYYEYEGVKKISALPARPITPAEKAQLTEQGRKFAQLVAKPSHVVCTTNLVVNKGWFTQRYRNQGRVMIDAQALKQADPDYFRRNYDEDDDGPITQIAEDALWTCEARVFGFSFALKKWGEMAVRDLVPINYRKDAYDKLVLDEKAKKAVLALVDRAHMGFSDIIDGKGGGCIFLMHGAPGLGKTMTAEAVADYLGRPLYSISAGELGIEPQQLEESLRKILDIAATWNAVILLDEADVYLEQRDEKDIVRNAMVGVFLRMLEYHSGVMFLTTNRVRQFDQAFFSRISMTLHYPEMTVESRTKVWNNLLEAAGAPGIDVTRLATIEVNGRQIKNIIRAAQALANRKEINEADLFEAIAITTQGSKDAGVQLTKTNGKAQPRA